MCNCWYDSNNINIINNFMKNKQNYLLELGNHIKSIRKEKQITQEKLAENIGKSHTSITRLEKGKINPGYIYLREIAEGLNINIEDLLKIKN